MTTLRGLTMTIASNYEQVAEAGRQLKEFLSTYDEITPLRFLAIHELLINAVSHGNNLDESKLVTLEVTVHDTGTVVITDEGQGFDWLSTLNRIMRRCVDSESGRGLEIVCHAVETLTFNPAGNAVTVFIPLARR